MLRTLLDLLAPPVCLACGAAAPDALCACCRAALPWLRDPCPRCALPRPCSPCPAARQAFAAARAPVAHDGPARALVHALKFRARLAAADAMAAQMATTLACTGEPAPPGLAPAALAGAALVPVPFAPARRRRRGFDPADLLAKRLAARTGLPVSACLRRSADAPRQVGAVRAERLRAGGVAAEVPAPEIAVLVDDVHTTGATLDACARALTRAGTRAVLALTYARTVRRA